MSLRLDPRETALLVIDMQNGWCHPEGTLGQDGADLRMIRGIIPRVRQLVELCRDRGIPDIWTLQEHFPDDRTRERHRVLHHTAKRNAVACAAGTWDAEVIDELKPLLPPETHLIRKHRFSAFYNTRLEVLLRMLGVQTLIVSGVTTNACIETSLRDGYMRDYDQVIVEDCIGGLDQALHDAAVRVWEKYLGLVVRLQDLPAMLPAPTAAGPPAR
ncbi:MAG: cysteine hydrolase [Deltaproteobacteria bacterium]|nr:cysteine hydrolase [Deltaproteobacteria bacterium]